MKIEKPKCFKQKSKVSRTHQLFSSDRSNFLSSNQRKREKDRVTEKPKKRIGFLQLLIRIVGTN